MISGRRVIAVDLFQGQGAMNTYPQAPHEQEGACTKWLAWLTLRRVPPESQQREPWQVYTVAPDYPSGQGYPPGYYAPAPPPYNPSVPGYYPPPPPGYYTPEGPSAPEYPSAPVNPRPPPYNPNAVWPP